MKKKEEDKNEVKMGEFIGDGKVKGNSLDKRVEDFLETFE